MKRIILFLCSVFMAASVAMSVPASKNVIQVTQPDGSKLSVLLYGDEHFHYATTSDGYLIDNVDGKYEYAEFKAGMIRPTGIAAQEPDLRSQTVKTMLSGIGKAAISPAQFSERVMKSPRKMEAVPQRANVVGEKGLVILVNFKDVKFTHTKEDFEKLLNQDNYTYQGATGSVHDYFKVASNGAYNPKFDVYGPYTLDNPMRFYGNNNSLGNDEHPDQMVVDAMNKLADDKSANVNFADYDTDNDGKIDNVFIYYAGYGENQSGEKYNIWPHRWVVFADWVTNYRESYGGKILYDYACSCELKGYKGSTLCGVGTFCHEFSHVLGLPDLYDTEYQGYKTIGDWDVMDSGVYNNDENNPPTYSAYERFYVGWLQPEILAEPKFVRFEELQKSNTAFVITKTGKFTPDPKNPDPNEFYIIENRQQTGWDSYLPGHGMLITKVKYDADKWEYNTVNDDESDMGVDIIEADGINGKLSEREGVNGKPGDTFPGSANVTSYSPYASMPITDIGENNGIISFSFKGAPDTAVEAADMNSILLIKNSDNSVNIVNMPIGAKIYCTDFVGRLIWQGEATSPTVGLPAFNVPSIITILHNDNITSFKNL